MQGQQSQQRKAQTQHQAHSQSSKRVVTVSHEAHAGNSGSAKQPRYEYEGLEPGEMVMPLQMPPLPMHMHSRAPQQDPPLFPLLQDPSQGPPFPQDRPEDPRDPRFLPRQESPREWFRSEPMSMASLPQPWHVHERQMSGHMGHPMELHAGERYAVHDGRMPHQEGEHPQSMHLPPMPMQMPPGEHMYNGKGQYPQQYFRDDGMGHNEHFERGPGLPPNFGGPHSQGFGMYGPPEQLPFPPQ